MDKRPLWPIAVGVVGWGAVAYAIYNDIWWPLWIALPLSTLPALGAIAVWIGTRRARRAAPEMVPAQATSKRAREPERGVVEPPSPTRGGPRTNARTAGRRSRGGAGAVALWLGAAFAGDGCKREDDAQPTKAAPTAAAPGKAAVPGSPAAPAPAPEATTPEQRALAAALARAIKAPEGSDATYRVDPFVAALVFEVIRSGNGPTFTQLAAPAKDGGPRVGFTVGDVPDGSLFHTLGLRKGDVIEALNGVELSDESRIAFALDGAENSVRLTIFRDDISLVQSYRLTAALAWTELLASQTGTAIAAAEGGEPVPTSDEGIAPPEDDGRGDGAAPADDGSVDDGGTTPSGGGTTPSGGGGTPSGGGKLPSGGGGTKPPSGGGSSTPTKPSGGGGTTPPPPSGTSQVKCDGSRCTISRAYFDKMTSSPSAISSQATIVPAISNDVFSGYKLKTVKPGSNVAKLGFQSGDKITHINGKDLTDDIEAAQVYFSLGSTKVFKIRFVRGGSQQVKTVVVE